MIDLHCHLLPGIDDGARDMTEALALLQHASAQGITRMVLTPHWLPGYFENSAAKVQHALHALQNAASDIAISLRVAQEVRICGELLTAIPDNELLFIGEHQGYKVLLLEFPGSHLTPGYEKLIRWLLNQNILPMIAHPERNRELLQHPDRIKTLQQFGCLFQLTASALLGDMGEDSRLLAERYLQEGYYHIMATDSHSLKRRPPRLAEARQRATELLGAAVATELVLTRPGILSEPLFRS